MAFRHLWFLFHSQHSELFVKLNDARALQLLYRGLLVAHDATRLLLAGKVDELLEREEQQVVSCHHEQVVVNLQFVESKQQVADGSQTGFIGFRTVVNDGDRFAIVYTPAPLFKDGSKAMVCNNDVLVNGIDTVDIVEHAA